MTQQSPDRLRFAGEEFSLDEYLLPRHLPGATKLRPKSAYSALWRGYIAIFAVRDGHLYLDEIDTPFEPDTVLHDTLRALSPADQPAVWFTGLLPLERWQDIRPAKVKRIGGRRQRVEWVEHPRQELRELLQIEAGRLVRHWRMNLDQYDVFCEEQTTYFLMSADYTAAWGEHQAQGWQGDEAMFRRCIHHNIVGFSRTVFVEPADIGLSDDGGPICETPGPG